MRKPATSVRCDTTTSRGHSVPAPSCPFDWHAEFPEIMRRGGFDVVIGNPPYLSFSGRHSARIPPPLREYLRSTYDTKGWPAAHVYFVERSLKLLSRRIVAFVLPDQVGHLERYQPLRETIARFASLVEVRYWGEGLFPDAVTPALTFVADRQHQGQTAIYEMANAEAVATSRDTRDGRAWTIGVDGSLWARLWEHSHSLGDLVADVGVHTGNCARQLLAPAWEEASGTVPLLEGRQVSRYACDSPRRSLRLDYVAQDGERFVIRAEDRYSAADFVIRQTAAYPIVGPRRHAAYFRNSLLALYSPTDGTDVRYLVAILNSRLMRYVYTSLAKESRQKAFPQVKIGTLRKLPIRTVDLMLRADRERHDALACLVDQLLQAHTLLSELAPTQSEPARAETLRRIQALDRAIDLQVYELYDLTAEDIATIQRAF